MRPGWLLVLVFWPTVSQAGPADYRFEPSRPSSNAASAFH